MEQKSRTIIAAGRPGVGKSYMGNFLLTNNPKSQVFYSESNPEDYGVTKEIQVQSAYAEHLGCQVEFIDVPGSGDPSLSITEIADGLVSQVSKKTINAACMLVAAQDGRASAAEVLTVSFLKNFFKTTGIDTKEILWLIITRCQEMKPDQKFIKAKLEFLKKMGLEIREDHVVLFDSTTQSMLPFMQQVFKIKQDAGLKVETNIQKALQSFSQDVRKVSVSDPCIKQEFEAFEMMMRAAMQTNDKLAVQLQKQADALREMVSNNKEEKKMMMDINNRLTTQIEKQSNALREMAQKNTDQMDQFREMSQKLDKMEDIKEFNRRLESQLDKQNERIKQQEERSQCSIF